MVDADLLALASEELRGPLTSVTGFLQLLLDGEAGELTDGQARIAEIAARNADKMARMIDDLIVIAQVHSGGLAESRAAVDVAAIVRERVFAIGADLRARRATVGIDVEPCPQISGDAPSITHMVDEMLRGAATFVPANGRVDVAVRPHGDGVVVEVGDDGTAPDRGDLDGIFAGSAAPPARSPRALLGSRMGMQLVRAVAQAHGGDASMVCDDGRTRVRVTLAA